MDNQEINHIPKNGQWTLKDGVPHWREQIGKGDKKTFEYYLPSQVGLKKEAVFSIATSKEILTHETLTSEALVYFIQHVKVSVREDEPHVWLIEQDGQLFVKHLMIQTTGKCPLKSDPWVIVTKSEFIRTSLKKIKAFQKKRIVLACNRYDSISDTYGIQKKAK